MTQTGTDFTKAEINVNTTVTHKSRNNYSYQYNAGGGRYFHCNVGNNDNEVILTEDYEDGQDENYMLGYASKKKEFVDAVYENLHQGRI